MKMARGNAEKDYCVKIFTISKNKKTKYLYCKKPNIALIMGERGVCEVYLQWPDHIFP